MKTTTILGLECFNIIGGGQGIRPSLTSKIDSVVNCILIIDVISIRSFDKILHSNPNHDKYIKSFLQPSAIHVIEKMSHGFNRLGKVHGKGFFNYDTDPPTLWSGLKVFEKRKVNIPEQDVTDRLTFAAVIGALQTTAEEAATIDPEIKALIPPGLPLSRQEALSWIDNYGESRFAARMNELAAAYGKRFSDPRSAGSEVI
jgi:hypothetical protein